MSDIVLFAHPTFGVLGMVAAVWVFVETLNASEANQARIRMAAYATTACIVPGCGSFLPRWWCASSTWCLRRLP